MKSYKAAYSVGAVALVLAGAVHSAPPTRSELDNWTVTNGVIQNVGCASGYTCANALTDAGFYMRMVTDSTTGKSYFQTIVTEANATAVSGDLNTLTFSDENFVSYQNENGILDGQRINEQQVLTYPSQTTTHTVTFKNGSIIGTGAWAKDFLELTQNISDSGDNFQIDFFFKQKGYSNGTSLQPYAKGMKITNYVPLGSGDRQDFVLVENSGDFTDTAGPVNLPHDSANPNGGTLTWVTDNTTGSNGGTVGDHIQALWIGQKLATLGQQFGFGSYINWGTDAIQDQHIWAFSLGDTWGNPTTGVPNPVLTWNTGFWGDIKTQGAVADPFAPVP